MLTELLPDQISRLWPIIKYAVEQSLPPVVGEHPDKMNRLLSAMLSGKLGVWASYEREDNKFEAILVTQFLYDDASGTKNLLLYCLYGYKVIDKNSWVQGIELMSKYAKSKGCSRIVAYTSEPLIVKLVESLGGNTEYTFISFDLD